MNNMKTTLATACALAAVLTVPVSAQQIQVGAKVGEPAPSAGSYESLGRRDPFVSLITPRRTAITGQPRVGTGLQSFFVSEVAVTGVARKGDLMLAILQGPDKQSYVAKVKDKLADGVVKSIDPAGVVLVEFADSGPGGVGRPRDVRKLLHPADEVIR